MNTKEAKEAQIQPFDRSSRNIFHFVVEANNNFFSNDFLQPCIQFGLCDFVREVAESHVSLVSVVVFRRGQLYIDATTHVKIISTRHVKAFTQVSSSSMRIFDSSKI